MDFVNHILSLTQPEGYLENPEKQAKTCLSEDVRRQVKEYERLMNDYKVWENGTITVLRSLG